MPAQSANPIEPDARGGGGAAVRAEFDTVGCGLCGAPAPALMPPDAGADRLR